MDIFLAFENISKKKNDAKRIPIYLPSRYKKNFSGSFGTSDPEIGAKFELR